MGFGCSILNGQVIYIEKSKLNIADMWLIPFDRVTYMNNVIFCFKNRITLVSSLKFVLVAHIKAVWGAVFLYCISQKKQALKYYDEIYYIKMYYKQSSVIYILNCHIVYLSLPKDKCDFTNSFDNVTSKVNIDAGPFLLFFFWVVDCMHTICIYKKL